MSCLWYSRGAPKLASAPFKHLTLPYIWLWHPCYSVLAPYMNTLEGSDSKAASSVFSTGCVHTMRHPGGGGHRETSMVSAPALNRGIFNLWICTNLNEQKRAAWDKLGKGFLLGLMSSCREIYHLYGFCSQDKSTQHRGKVKALLLFHVEIQSKSDSLLNLLSCCKTAQPFLKLLKP